MTLINLPVKYGSGLALLFLSVLVGNAERLPVTTFSMADGLPSANINCIVRDSNNFLWFCTEEGLSRFDGYSFINYGMEQGLPDRTVTGLIQTPDGEYWVSTFKGLCRFNPTAVIKRRPNNSPEPMSFFDLYKPRENELASRIAGISQSVDGNIWCSTLNGIYLFDRRSKQFDLKVPSQGDWWTAMLPAKDGSLWFGSKELFHRLQDGRTERYGTKEGFAPNLIRVSDLLTDRAGRLWVATWQGLYRMKAEPEPGQSSVDRFYDEHDGLASHAIFSLFETSGGQLLAGVERAGAFEFCPASPGIPDHFRPLAGKNGLESPELGVPSVDVMNEDTSGNIWLSHGLRVNRTGFVSYGTQDGLKTSDIGSIFEDHDGRLVVLSCDSRCRYVNAFDGDHFRSVQLRLPKGVKQVTWGSGQIHFQDHLGVWWVATDAGLCRFPAGSSLADLAKKVPSLIYDLKGREVFRLFEDSRGDIWISVLGSNAVCCWRRQTGRVESYWKGEGGVNLDVPTKFTEDRAGNVWIGFYGPNVARYRNGRFEVFSTAQGMPKSSVRDLFIDHVGRLWIGTTRAGLVRVDDPVSPTPRFASFSTQNGLSSSEINAITEDHLGRLYLGTGRGIDRFDPATAAVRHFTAAEGLGFSATPRVAYRDRKGVLWFGGSGLLRFVPPAADEPTHPPPIRISHVNIRGVGYPISELGENSVGLPRLRASQNDLHIEFQSSSFALGQTIRYQYRLQPSDPNWGRPTEQRSINYANLGPGAYKFQVRAVTSDGILSPEPAEVLFTIESPFWRRWWFVLTTAVLVGIAIALGHNYRVKQLVAIERIRTNIATDLHDDIGSTLSQIALLTGLARKDAKTDPSLIEPQLTRIGDLSLDLADSMAEIVWALNPRHDRLADLTAHMRRFASDLLSARDIGFDFTVAITDEAEPLSPDARRHLFLIFKECVNNIVKHSFCSHVRAALTISQDQLDLVITDNGDGFDVTKESSGNGIASIHQRTRSIGGRLTLQSSSDQGTKTHLVVPLRRFRILSLPKLVAKVKTIVRQNEGDSHGL